MHAWVVDQPGPIDTGPLRLVERPVPVPGAGQIRVQVRVCGVCRTDLHLAEGDLTPRRPQVVPGHEVVGTVVEQGPGASRFALGDRVGIAWLARSCGDCRFCHTGRENLCLDPRFTGWDTDGGYAEQAVVDEAFAYRLPAEYDDEEVAPLLCAGIIGYRALRRSDCPSGGRLGIYGFGASAHITAQLALAEEMRVHVFTRSSEARRLALDLGASSASDVADPPPEPLDAALVFAPAGSVVPTALAGLDRGGVVAIAGIHLSDIPSLEYQRHLFQERELRSVTANTRADGTELLARAAAAGVRVTTTSYSLADAPVALGDLAHSHLTGAAVLVAPGT
ncbi:MAG: zinc-dependent alcohol dehydrogenase family protein [Actinomycetota bacterium]|jgi:propanol-preferring alcohol dehydrogenase|nr:zinc-dependent alcohol dehydrogenase family protein [Actinomycetota bacterium]